MFKLTAHYVVPSQHLPGQGISGLSRKGGEAVVEGFMLPCLGGREAFKQCSKIRREEPQFLGRPTSIKVAVPRMAKTMVFSLSMGTDLMTMAFVPVRQSASTCVSLSAPFGVS